MSTDEYNQIDYLSRNAEKVRKENSRKKFLATTLGFITALAVILYVVSVFWNSSSGFVIQVDKYNMQKFGISLSERPDFESPMSRLTAKEVEKLTNITNYGFDDSTPEEFKDMAYILPDKSHLTSVDGSNNGDNYFCYTFYLRNDGEAVVSYQYKVTVLDVENNLDEAIRIMIIKNDTDDKTYAKEKSDGSHEAEKETTKFLSQTTAVSEVVDGFTPGEITKYTVVIWLEGADKDCTPNLEDGKFKCEMVFTIIENA